MSQDAIRVIITAILENFSLSMLVLALLFIAFHKLIRRHVPDGEIVYRWISFFALGITSIYAFMMHAFFPVLAARNIGWATSPFQMEVAIANLAIGVVAILSFNASYSFRLAVVVVSLVWLWGDAINHLHQIAVFNNLSPGNAGSWLFTDAFVPLILLFSIRRLRTVQMI